MHYSTNLMHKTFNERQNLSQNESLPIQIHFKVPNTSSMDNQVLNCIHPCFDCSLPETKLLYNYNGPNLYSAPRRGNNTVYIIRCNQDQLTHLQEPVKKNGTNDKSNKMTTDNKVTPKPSISKPAKKEDPEVMDIPTDPDVPCRQFGDLYCKATAPTVHMVTDIMQQLYAFVKGPNNSNIEGMVKRTGAKINFPDVNSCHISKAEKRLVTMSGSLDM